MRKIFRKKQIVIASLLIAVIIFLSAKIYQYGALPTEQKEGNFVYPHHEDEAKPVIIKVNPSPFRIQFKQKGGFTNDASYLNKTSVYGIAKISSVEDVKNALFFAKENNLKVTSAGQQHSMGGQSFISNGLVLDMKNFNQMTLDKGHKILKVQSGAIWANVQEFLNKEGLAVKAMQSINIFTVGGTLSVNAHGIDHCPGSIAPTVKSMHIMLSSGEIKTASPVENSELFRSVLGGYGLLGVILDVDLEVVDNEIYQWTRDFMNYRDFPEYYKKNIENHSNIGLLYGRLSLSPTSYLKEVIIHKYGKKLIETKLPPLQFPKHTWINRLVINFSKTGNLGRWIRWMLEKYVEPTLHLCSRNQAMGEKEVCLVSRNQEMYDTMNYLKNRLKDTDILQEYFVPHDQMPEFIDGLRNTVKRNGANLLNVTIRIVSKDHITSLPYAKENMFAFVLCFNQKFNEKESRILEKTTRELIDLAIHLDGTFYLPYQLYYSKEQLRKAYPEIDAFFEIKKHYDSIGLFSNKFYEKYGKKQI
ncbi:MAG: FAD-binding oxidoreductase [Chlamydiae bacterium]|nr:FAD-binding oxidoreductase [Chlamydiota bacterium]MBI3276157.1 FAD-binding oxidoreductase [Chlamydiota bacterium]